MLFRFLDKIFPYSYYFIMNKKLKNLPIGISDFKRIRENEYLYIDKTEGIYELISGGMYYFLSRPRRFGKSLLVSTLYNIFRGKKELFKGLYIYDSDYEWEEYPIIRLDFNGISNTNPEMLNDDIRIALNRILKQEEIEPVLNNSSIQTFFTEVIIRIYEKYKKSIVFLVDEYDKPIISHIGKGKEELKIADKNRELLKDFYGVLKEIDVVTKTRFVFITGITKFSKVSIFSELNNLTDLTMNKRYCDILGITEDEMDRDLTPYIERFCKEENINCEELREELRGYYNGYRFSSKDVRVYNPFSLFTALEYHSIENYWFETGTPTFLINLIKKQNIYIPEYEKLKADEYMFSTYEISDLSTLPLMFQSGYLTIRDYDKRLRLYELGYPNKEVKESFTKNLFAEYSGLKRNTKYADVRVNIEDGKIEEAIEVMKSIFSEIPYTLMREDMINELYFHMMFYLIISASGVGITSEILTAKGRIDALIETRDRYYIIEFKCDQDSSKAIQQIKEKKYYEPYKYRGKEIVLIGINFSTEDKNISDYKIEKLRTK